MGEVREDRQWTLAWRSMRVAQREQQRIKTQHRQRRWKYMMAVRARKAELGLRPTGKEYDKIDMLAVYARWNAINLADSVAAEAAQVKEAALDAAAKLRDGGAIALFTAKRHREDRVSVQRTLNQRVDPLMNTFRAWYIREWVQRLRASVLTANAAALSIQGRYRLWGMHCAVLRYRAQRNYAGRIILRLFRDRIGMSRRGSLSRERHAAACRIQRLMLRTISLRIWTIERERHAFPHALRHGSSLFLQGVTGAFVEAAPPRRVMCESKTRGAFQRWTVWQRKRRGQSRHAMLRNGALVRLRSVTTGEWLTACGTEEDGYAVALRRTGVRKDQWFVLRKKEDGAPITCGDEVTVEARATHRVLNVESEDERVCASRAPRKGLSAWSVFTVRAE
jgi:hypothetical protein